MPAKGKKKKQIKSRVHPLASITFLLPETHLCPGQIQGPGRSTCSPYFSQGSESQTSVAPSLPRKCSFSRWLCARVTGARLQVQTAWVRNPAWSCPLGKWPRYSLTQIPHQLCVFCFLIHGGQSRRKWVLMSHVYEWSHLVFWIYYTCTPKKANILKKLSLFSIYFKCPQHLVK